MGRNNTYLTDEEIQALQPQGTLKKYSMGKGLCLYVSPAGGKLWRMNYRISGKQKTLSLGKYPATSLERAMTLRDRAKELIAAGIDPAGEKLPLKMNQASLMEAWTTFIDNLRAGQNG